MYLYLLTRRPSSTYPQMLLSLIFILSLPTYAQTSDQPKPSPGLHSRSPSGSTAALPERYEGTIKSFLASNPQGLGLKGMTVNIHLKEHEQLDFVTDGPTAVKWGLFQTEEAESTQLIGKKGLAWKVRPTCTKTEDSKSCRIVSFEVLDWGKK